jgi:1,4-dihydroxy-6-naphthoate synthase
MHASEMDPVVQQQHIDLYVNRYSVDLGDDGKMAIRKLLQVGLESGVMAPAVEPLFV